MKMNLISKNILSVFFILSLSIPSLSFASAHEKSDIYEDIICGRTPSFSPSSLSSESPPPFSEWILTLEELLISSALHHEAEGKGPIKGADKSGPELKLPSHLTEHVLKYGLYKESAYPALHRFFLRTLTEPTDSLQIFLIRGLSSLISDLRDQDVQPVRVAALLSLLLRVDVPENYEFNFIQFLNSIIQAKRFDLFAVPLKGYCDLGHQYKIIEHLSQVVIGLVGHVRLDDLCLLLDAHQNYLTNRNNINEQGLSYLLKAYETFFLIPDFLKHKSFILMCACLQPHMKDPVEALSLQNMKTQALYVQNDPGFLSEFTTFILQEGFDGYLETRSPLERQTTLENVRSAMLTLGLERNLDLQKRVIEKALPWAQRYPKDIADRWVSDFYFHKAVNMMGSHSYAEAVSFIKDVYLPFIERHRRQSPELYGTKPMAGCLLSLAAVRSQNDKVALEQLPSLLTFISLAESSSHPVVQSLLPLTKIVTSNILFKTGRISDRLKGKMYIASSYATVMTELGKRKEQTPTSVPLSADFAFFLLNALELAHMNQEANDLSKLLIEVNLQDLLQEAKPKKSSSRKKARKKEKRKEAMIRKIKEDQERNSSESAQSQSSRGNTSPVRGPQNSSPPRSSAANNEAPDFYGPQFYPQGSRTVNLASEYRKQEATQKVKVKTRKEPEASSSQTIPEQREIKETPVTPPSSDLSKYHFLLKDETFLALFRPNKERGKVTLHDFKNLLAHLGGTVTNGSRHGKATMPQEDFMGIVLTLPTDTLVKPYMLNNLRDILSHIGITPETLTAED